MSLNVVGWIVLLLVVGGVAGILESFFRTANNPEDKKPSLIVCFGWVALIMYFIKAIWP